MTTSPIYRLGKKTKRAPPRGYGVFTFKFSTGWLLEKFGLPELREFGDKGLGEFWLRDEDLVNCICLDVTMNKEEDLVDERGKVLTRDEVEDIKLAYSDASRSGTLAQVQSRIFSALEVALGTFADYRYEYLFQADEGSTSASGVATGITSVEVGSVTTTIVAQDDIIHIINHNIAGDGMFHATDDFEGEAPYQFAKTRFGWLSRHWDIHGGSPPEVDLDNVEGFDENYLKQQLKSMRGLKLTLKSRKAPRAITE